MYQVLKRLADILFSLLMLVLTAPFLLLLALAVRLDSPGPALFRQKRIGRDESTFFILKFRTMRTDTPKDCPTHLLKDAGAHVTRTGRFLRRTSLDELPQLFNILKGDMSLVGPRPALWNQDDLIALRRANGSHACRPGLTGWAQVNGRDELAIEVKADLDGYYVRHGGPVLDIRIVFRTLFQVFRADGIAEGSDGGTRAG